jgi:hypothetical protein
MAHANEDHSRRYSRDEDQKAQDQDGRPPRPATEPKQGEGSSNTGKTRTDPATGEPNRGRR